MSQIVRQENLFAGEDWRKVYKAFQDVDFRAYDFDTLKQALIEYIRKYYPEDFNDYIESSEFIAIIELLSYLGTSLAFRVDLNSRENILDTAERRESIIRLARMINYQPKRNIAARGMFKISAVQTNEPLVDADNIDLNNVPIFWNDPNNPFWFDQFIQILNAAFDPTNPFGRPSKTGSVGNIPTDLYTLNNVLGLEVAYNVRLIVNGETIEVDVVNPDYNESFYERQPDQNQPFNFIYRNDSLGVGSANTGFFLYFKQGRLNKVDNNFEFPVPNRVLDIPAENINQSDVYVQEIDDAGEVLTQWTPVPALTGNNIIFNNLNFDVRKIFEVISGLNDTVSIKFADGNFGDVPTGLMRTWYRTSIGRNIVIRPDDASGLTLTLPYIGIDGLEYNLRITFDLEQTVSNSAPAETNTQVKLRAPQVYYSQDRMVNNEDYNVYPLTRGNEIAKLKSINRTYAGHSRYLDINDPTGFHQDLIIFGEDGYIYKDDEPGLVVVNLETTVGDISNSVVPAIEAQLKDPNLQTFFYQDYVTLIDSSNLDLTTITAAWITAPDVYESPTGYFKNTTTLTDISLNTTGPYGLIKAGAMVTFENSLTVAVRSVSNTGIPYETEITNVGPVALSTAVLKELVPVSVIPAFRTVLNQQELTDVSNEIDNNLSSFGLVYNYVNDTWTIDVYATAQDPFVDTSTSWLLYVNSVNNTYEITSRGTVYVFGSDKSVRFYWDPEQPAYDSVTGKSLYDVIEILPKVNNDSNGVPLDRTLFWSINGTFITENGYQDTSKIEILPSDLDEDGVPDAPASYNSIISENDVVVFKLETMTSGDELYNPWKTGWIQITTDSPVIDVVGNTIDIKPITLGNLIDLNDSEDLISPADPQTQLNNMVASLNLNFASGNTTLILNTKLFIDNLSGKTFRLYVENAGSTFKKIVYVPGTTTDYEAVAVDDYTVFEKNGKSSTQNTNIDPALQEKVYFKWKHYAPIDQRIDPSVSNIIDTIILTETYLRDVLIWKDEDSSTLTYPAAPTTEELRIQFDELNSSKMISDQIIYNSGKFKVLFGPQASPELQAIFKAIKISSAQISDNEIKTQLITAVDEFFDINNWDFGETFYYTELAAYIHKRMSKYLSSVVIVPKKQESQFGNLFEVSSRPDELFLSTATVSDVEIVKNFTETNLRM